MAEKRGGRRYPKEPASYSGVGKGSRRTDTQRVQVPNVGDAEDLSYGDRQKLETAQRTAPLSRVPEPRVSAPAAGMGGGGGSVLPEHLFAGESSRPHEPITAGLDFGPGPGSEAITPPAPETDQEIVLQFLADTFQDDAATKMLNEIRNQRAVPDEPLAAPTASSQGVVEPMEPEPLEFGPQESPPATEEPVEDVEEPEVV